MDIKPILAAEQTQATQALVTLSGESFDKLTTSDAGTAAADKASCGGAQELKTEREQKTSHTQAESVVGEVCTEDNLKKDNRKLCNTHVPFK